MEAEGPRDAAVGADAGAAVDPPLPSLPDADG